MNLESIYQEILENLCQIFDKKIVLKQRDNLVLKILFYVPFCADSINPYRIAMANINNYFLFSNPLLSKYFCHNQLDDSNLFSRLSLLYNIPNGSYKTIEKGKLFLALIMLQDHFADKRIDFQHNKYNPLVSNAWDYKEKKKYLLNKINSLGITCLDQYVSLSAVLNQSFWKA